MSLTGSIQGELSQPCHRHTPHSQESLTAPGFLPHPHPQRHLITCSPTAADLPTVETQGLGRNSTQSPEHCIPEPPLRRQLC